MNNQTDCLKLGFDYIDTTFEYIGTILLRMIKILTFPLMFIIVSIVAIIKFIFTGEGLSVGDWFFSNWLS